MSDDLLYIIGIACAGMGIVFAGLAILALAVRLLPRLTERTAKPNNPSPTPAATTASSPDGLSPELVLALTAVLHEELRSCDDDPQRLTLDIEGQRSSIWANSRGLRTLPT